MKGLCFFALLILLETNMSIAGYKPISQVRKYLENNKRCFIAVSLNLWSMESGTSGSYDSPDPLVDADHIYCVADLVFKEGSIDEMSGCILSGYDAGNDSYMYLTPPESNHSPFMSSKACAKGGADEVLAQKDVTLMALLGLGIPYEKGHQMGLGIDILTLPVMSAEKMFIYTADLKYKIQWLDHMKKQGNEIYTKLTEEEKQVINSSTSLVREKQQIPIVKNNVKSQNISLIGRLKQQACKMVSYFCN